MLMNLRIELFLYRFRINSHLKGNRDGEKGIGGGTSEVGGGKGEIWFRSDLDLQLFGKILSHIWKNNLEIVIARLLGTNESVATVATYIGLDSKPWTLEQV